MEEIEGLPKVSVIVPNYNHAAYLPERLDSILNQTYRNFELIVIDDASSDASREIISRYQGENRLQAIFNNENSGNLFKNWNLGVRKARGKFIWIAESDDYSDPRFLEILVPCLEQNPEVGVVYCQSLSVDEQGEIRGSMQGYTSDLDGERWKKTYINRGKHECLHYLIHKNTIPNASAVVFRKSIYVKAGYADESIYYGNDWLTWISLLRISDICFIDQSLNYYRDHSGTVRGSMDLTEHEIRASFQVLKYILDHFDVDSEIRKKALNQRARGWVNIFFRGKEKTNWRMNQEIFTLVGSFDSLIYFRFLRELILFPFKITLAKFRSLIRKIKG